MTEPWNQGSGRTTTQTVTGSGGARLSYSSAGPGPAVLLIQGVGVAGTGWRPQVEALAERMSPGMMLRGIAPPRLGRSLAQGIAGARFVEFPQAGRALPIQCAAETNALLENHLAAAEASPRAQSST